MDLLCDTMIIVGGFKEFYVKKQIDKIEQMFYSNIRTSVLKERSI